MKTKTLFLHIGGAKTGSSSIQNFFSKYESLLKDNAIAYIGANPQNDYNIPNSGNGVKLFQVIRGGLAKAEIINQLELFFGSHSKAFCSSEFFEEFARSEWEFLGSVLEEMRIDLRILYFIRNPLDFYRSSYDQHLKRQGEKRGFNEWISDPENRRWRPPEVLGKNIPIKYHNNMMLIPIDEVSTNVILETFNFLEIILDSENKKLANSFKRVNRALNCYERAILLLVNALKGVGDNKLLGTTLSDRFISEGYEFKSRVSIDKELVSVLCNELQDGVLFVNSFIDQKQNHINLFQSIADEAEKIEIQYLHLTKTLEIFCEWLRDGYLQKATINNFYEQQRKIETSAMEISPEIPFDFDPVEYLSMHLDVFFAEQDPIQHYIAYGKLENRKFKK